MCGHHILHITVRIDGPFRTVGQMKFQQEKHLFLAKAGDDCPVLKRISV